MPRKQPSSTQKNGGKAYSEKVAPSPIAQKNPKPGRPTKGRA